MPDICLLSGIKIVKMRRPRPGRGALTGLPADVKHGLMRTFEQWEKHLAPPGICQLFRQGLAEDGKREVCAYLADIGVIRFTICLEIGGSIITAGFQQFVQFGVFDIGTCRKGF